MFNFKVNIEDRFSLKTVLFVTIFGFFLFWLSFQIPDLIGEAIYWVSIVTFSMGILLVAKKILIRVKNKIDAGVQGVKIVNTKLLQFIGAKYIWILIALVTVFLFYWLQLRPVLIKKDCHKWVIDQPGEINVIYKSSREKYDALFEFCLHEKGLK